LTKDQHDSEDSISLAGSLERVQEEEQCYFDLIARCEREQVVEA